MILPIAFIVAGGIGSLFLWLVGLVIIFAIVFAILRALAAPGWMFTALNVVGLILLLLVALDFFFGNGSAGEVIVR